VADSDVTGSPSAPGPAPAPEVLWQPDLQRARRSRLVDFARWSVQHAGAPQAALDDDGVGVAPYDALRRWSVEQPEAFWRALWEWDGVVAAVPPAPGAAGVLPDASMPGTRWFPGTRLNYTAQVLRHLDTGAVQPGDEAVVGVDEDGVRRALTWGQLRSQVGALAAALRARGVGRGDRVAAHLPSVPESVVALLATASLGAVWVAAGQDTAGPAAAVRLGRTDPVALVVADGYRYGGRVHERGDATRAVVAACPSLRLLVRVPVPGVPAQDLPPLPAGAAAVDWDDAVSGGGAAEPVAVPFDHPLWVLSSSGTTGTPKGIVHGHGGVVLEHVKSLALHTDLGPGDRFAWWTSPSWMMWDYLAGALLVGAAVVLRDGSPTHPGPDALWRLAADERLAALGTSPGYLQACEDAGVDLSALDLSALRYVGSTGSPLSPACARWAADALGRRVPVVSLSGGTDVVTAFVAGAPTVPTWAGELSVRCLGAPVAAWSGTSAADGHELVDQVGELVLTAPLPSMPVALWDDPGGARLRAAYFEDLPGLWRHGDWVTVTSRGSVVVHGRSDATLNRHGVRMGTGDFYAVLDRLPELADSLVVGLELPDGRRGGYWMPLFVVPADGVELDDALRQRLCGLLRTELSPRHVPDVVVAVPAVPRTATGKRREVPVKRVLAGDDPGDDDELAAFVPLRP
jgi:acetoacetyl-CoA synthetase